MEIVIALVVALIVIWIFSRFVRDLDTLRT